MCRLSVTLIVGGLFVIATTAAEADHHSHSYPKVRTFSGGYYGPTQAHYQYQRRYGRPWQGHGGLYSGHGVGFTYYHSRSRPTYGYGGHGYGGYGYSRSFGTSLFGFGYGVSPYYASPYVSYPLGVPIVQPTLIPHSPGIFTPLPSANPLAKGGLQNNGYQWQQEPPGVITPQGEILGIAPLGKADVPLQTSSTPEARLRSLRHQQHGDARLRNLDYLQASLRYEDAIKAAADRAEPHYRLAIAQMGMKRFDKAVRELKAATALDPTWVESVTLLELLGDDNLIGKVQLKQRVADWALKDAYDADRLYLLGTLLHLDGDPDRARILFDTAVALIGNQPHLTVFLAQPISPVGHEEVAPPSKPAPLDVPELPTSTGPAFPSEFE